MDAAGDEKASGPRSLIDCPLDRAEHLRHRLPLVKQHGLRQRAQRGVWVVAKRFGFSLPVETHNSCGQAFGCRRLPGGAGTGYQECGQFVEKLAQPFVNQPCGVAGARHKGTIALWTNFGQRFGPPMGSVLDQYSVAPLLLARSRRFLRDPRQDETDSLTTRSEAPYLRAIHVTDRTRRTAGPEA